MTIPKYFLRGILIALAPVVLACFDPGIGRSYAQQGDGRNIFETKRSSAPSTPRPKTDEAITNTLREAFQQDFGPNSVQTYFVFLGFFLILGGVVIVLVRYDVKHRRRFRSAYEDPDFLFRELCAVHGLTKAERRFLRNLADDLELDDPLPLFIEPKHFLRATDAEKYQTHKSMLHYFLEKLFDFESEESDSSIVSGTHPGGATVMDPPSISGHTTVYRPYG